MIHRLRCHYVVFICVLVLLLGQPGVSRTIVIPEEEASSSDGGEAFVQTCGEEINDRNANPRVVLTSNAELFPDSSEESSGGSGSAEATSEAGSVTGDSASGSGSASASTEYRCETLVRAPFTWWRDMVHVTAALVDTDSEDQLLAEGCTLTVTNADTGALVDIWDASNFTDFALDFTEGISLLFVLDDTNQLGTCSLVIDLLYTSFPRWNAQLIFVFIALFAVLPAGIYIARALLSNNTGRQSPLTPAITYITVISFSLALFFMAVGYSEWTNWTSCAWCRAPLVVYLGWIATALFIISYFTAVILGFLTAFGVIVPKYVKTDLELRL